MKNKNKSMYYDNKEKEEIEVSLNKEINTQLEIIDVVDVKEKEIFINKINEIVNSDLRGYFKIENVDLKGVKDLLNNYLDFIDVKLPILMSKSKLKQNFRDFDHNRHFHGMEAEAFYNAILSLNDPLFISQNLNNKNEITFITNINLYNKVTKENEKVTIAFSFNFQFKSRGGRK